MKKNVILVVTVLVALFIVLMGSGCNKPFDVPELKTITPSQTGFLVPLIGVTSDQAKMNSKEFLANAKIATKEVQIPHREIQIGRWSNEVQYIPTMRLIVVERKPVTREWTESAATGTSTKDDAIRAESKESIGFIAKMNCVAQIDEENAVLYLFRYNDKPLEEVMDQEIRAKVASKFVELSSKYYLRDEENGLLANKSTIMDEVRDYVTPFFAERGITITVLGLAGDFAYDTQVQSAINDRFVAKQLSQKAADEAEAIKIIKNAGGLEFYLEQKKLAIAQQNADTYRKATEGWINGGAKIPQAMGGGSLLQVVPEPPKP